MACSTNDAIALIPYLCICRISNRGGELFQISFVVTVGFVDIPRRGPLKPVLDARDQIMRPIAHRHRDQTGERVVIVASFVTSHDPLASLQRLSHHGVNPRYGRLPITCFRKFPKADSTTVISSRFTRFVNLPNSRRGFRVGSLTLVNLPNSRRGF
jgi:hypothetical protein